MSSPPLFYKDAGVDIVAGDALVERIKPLAKKTMREGVLAGIGGFGALFEVPKRYKEPVLVSGTDGDQVNTNSAVHVPLKCQFQFGANAVCARDKDGLFVAFWDFKQSTKSTNSC